MCERETLAHLVGVNLDHVFVGIVDVDNAAAGATSFTVASTANIRVGGYLMVTELNDSSIPVNPVGDEGNCTWCDDWNGTRALGQIVEVTGISGNNVTFSPPLYITYLSSLSPLATPFNAAAKYAGIEAGRLAYEMHEWQKAMKIYQRLQRMLPEPLPTLQNRIQDCERI